MLNMISYAEEKGIEKGMFEGRPQMLVKFLQKGNTEKAAIENLDATLPEIEEARKIIKAMSELQIKPMNTGKRQSPKKPSGASLSVCITDKKCGTCS